MASMLLLLVANPERDGARCEAGLLLALNTKRTDILNEVRVMLYGSGVRILDAEIDERDRFGDLLRRLADEGVEVVACSGSLLEHGVGLAARELGIAPAGAQVYLPARISEGFSVVTF